MIMSSILSWEINDYSIFLKFDMQIAFIFDGMRNFNTYFGWSLIPCICDFEIMANNFLFCYIFLPKLNESPTRNGFKFRLLNSLQ